MSQSNYSSDYLPSSQSEHKSDQSQAHSALNHEDIFQLINLIVSLEFCLEYQILPLKLKDNHLILGMVNLEDLAALNLVRSIANSLGYSVGTKLIDSNTHQSILAAYLEYTSSLQSPNWPTSQTDKAPLDKLHTLIETQETEDKSRKPANLHERPTLIVDQLESSSASEIPPTTSSSQEELANLADKLTPEQLWQQLYAQLLDGGIGRLYLERLSDCGRIFCSQNGVIQFSLDRVSFSTYQAMIQQVKALAKLSPAPLDKRKKVAIEKSHQQERLLLRLEMFPSKWGEEATVQVLRAEALDFYEQRQVKKMSEQAISLAIRLEKTVRKMRSYLDSADQRDVSILIELQQKINRHLKIIE